MTRIEDYMATWEAMLEAHTGHRCVPSLDETWEHRGTLRMRTLAIKIADGAVAEWKALSVVEKREAEPFDGPFLPDYLTRIRCFDPLILPAMEK